MCACWTYQNKPELDDIESDLDRKPVVLGVYPYCAVDKNDCKNICPQFEDCHRSHKKHGL